MINFAKYREEKLLAYTELQEHLEQLLADREALAGEHAALQEELERLQEGRAAEMPVRGLGSAALSHRGRGAGCGCELGGELGGGVGNVLYSAPKM